MIPSKYRTDIDGLRAFAVGPVVLFHAGVPWFSGGFVGVDIFFVISGFLITGILVREMEEASYSISGFYERRIRRIFPALFALLAFVLITAPLVLLPSEYREFPKEALGALFFIANIVFWRESGYFSDDAEVKPLLHTWSLGVEEQFYIFIPLILWFVLRHASRWRIPLMLAMFATSLALSAWFTPTKMAAAFYLLPSRAWELLAGSLLAMGFPRQVQWRWLREVIASLGLFLLLAAVFLYDARTPFPGLAALLPVAGAAMVLHSAPGTVAGRLLSQKLPVMIGLMSYSLYLWHWPLTVYFRDWNLLNGAAGIVLLVAASLVAGWASWRFVELPFRTRTRFPVPRLMKWSSAGAALLIALALASTATDGWPSRFSPEIQRYDMAREDYSPTRSRCHINGGLPDPERFCRLGDANPHVALWGDSHGTELAAAIADAGVPIFSITYSSCPPAQDLAIAVRPFCLEHNRRVLDFLAHNNDVSTVVLAARYPERQAGTYGAVRRSIDTLVNAGKHVIVVGPIPTAHQNIPNALSRGREPSFAYDGPDRAEFAARFPSSVSIVMPSESFCADGTCSMSVGNGALLFDDQHFTMTAARAFAPRVISEIQGGGIK